MPIEDILSAVSGAMQGGLAQYSWGKDYEQKERKITEDAETRRLTQEIRMMLGQMNNDTRLKVAGENNTSRETIAGANNASRETVAGANNASRETVAAGRNATTERGQDITQQLGITRDATTKRGQDLGFTLGTDRNATTRYGIDTGATTARRGQDITQSLGISAEGGRNTRATDANALREKEITSRETIAKQRRVNPWGGVSFDSPTEVPDAGTGKPTAEPIEVVERPDPTTALAPPPKSPEAGGDQLERLGAQVDSLMKQVQAASDPAQKVALKSQLKKALEAYTKAGGK